MKNKFEIKKISKISVLLFLLLVIFTSCDIRGYDIAGEGSKPDLTPPSADFTYTKGQGTGDDYKTYTFANQSISATDYLWDFGNGNTFKTVDAKFTFPGEGSYVVSLTASDKLGKTNTVKKTVEVVKPVVPAALVPVILAPGFDFGNVDASKDPWRNSALGGVIQISASSVFEGGFVAKFPSGSDRRIAYQELTVTPNTNYMVTCKYSQEIGPGSIRMAVLAGAVNDPALINSKIIKKEIGTNATGKGNFTSVVLSFNSGANSTIALYVDNDGGTISYVDSFTIALN
ncbi:PKD domain-containing protein [Chryseobacterium gotjawalense]|uniref:PKD domain-containing protein n=1 Tax=Chryseobacterium gotjawalense TaxID=3042315 RepID=A0ABY8RCR0_9FLAO|nr:PKD domain-containing protein [Chryseobacterium sp. wdc7]WHF51484.1 PKD domain-containing protein [Chryseobacterium sp. wdc7]